MFEEKNFNLNRELKPGPLYVYMQYIYIYIYIYINNHFLFQGYDSCTKWKDEIDNNNDTFREERLFEMGPQMQLLNQNVSERLGFTYRLKPRKYKLPNKDTNINCY